MRFFLFFLLIQEVQQVDGAIEANLHRTLTQVTVVEPMHMKWMFVSTEYDLWI